MSTGQVAWYKVVGWTAVMYVLVVWMLPLAWVSAVTSTITGAIVLESIVVITGFAGQISLAQWAIAGLGALVTAHLIVIGVPTEFAIVLGVLAGLPIGLLVGLASLRARGMSLAIATLAFGVCAVSLVLSNNSLDGGISGLSIGAPTILGINLAPTLYPRAYTVFTVLAFVAVTLAVANIRRGRAGRRLLAVRANERGAAALGVSVMGSKLAAFCYGAMIASLGGILTILRFPIALFSNFDAFTSITLISNAVVGGIGYLTGPLAGAVGQSSGVGSQIVGLFSSNDIQYVTLAFGILTMIVVVRSPDGLVPVQAAQTRAILRKLHLAKNSRAVSYVVSGEVRSTETDHRVALTVNNLTVAFGGVQALVDVSLSLHAGEVLGIIGPNGAGKTTLIDAITGFTSIKAGSLSLDDKDITEYSVLKRSREGIGRAFQSLELFEDMTVLDNVLVACDRQDWFSWLRDIFHPGRRVLSPAASRALEELGLADKLDLRPDALSYGARRLLALVRAIAAEPEVLLLDEPAAGLDERERVELAELIATIQLFDLSSPGRWPRDSRNVRGVG